MHNTRLANGQTQILQKHFQKIVHLLMKKKTYKMTAKFA